MMQTFERVLPRLARAGLLGALALGALPLVAQSNGAVLDFPMEVRYDVQVRMPDGVQISVDVFRPQDDERHPTLFSLTPYNNDSEGTMQQAWNFVQKGYAYVVGDTRGRYDSEGDFYP
ncbi:MAG: acetylxylan esterase, partial [Gemmatimonadota bacterium]|nr:acetylxylan esterase [Gemmatimonadota bacterium]